MHGKLISSPCVFLMARGKLFFPNACFPRLTPRENTVSTEPGGDNFFIFAVRLKNARERGIFAVRFDFGTRQSIFPKY
jgi:hypothetical protein